MTPWTVDSLQGLFNSGDTDAMQSLCDRLNRDDNRAEDQQARLDIMTAKHDGAVKVIEAISKRMGEDAKAFEAMRARMSAMQEHLAKLLDGNNPSKNELYSLHTHNQAALALAEKED